MAIDLASVLVGVVAFVAGGLFNALVAAGTGEYRARQDEKRASSRARQDRLREDRVRKLRALGGYIHLLFGQAAYRAAGDQDEAAKWLPGREEREPAWDLLGDLALLDAVLDGHLRLARIGEGKGLGSEEFELLHATGSAVERALAEQEERALADEALNRIDRDAVWKSLARYDVALRTAVGWMPGSRWQANQSGGQAGSAST